jgi:putative phosphoribosyl transferase
MFRDRSEAAERLAERLKAYAGQRPVILAIPRGAVPMALVVAKKLGGDLDVVLVRKLRAPHQPELAIGSVNERGEIHLNEDARLYGGTKDYIAAEARIQLATIHQRRAQYTQVRSSLDLAGRVVIVIDDGLATGATMLAALQWVRAGKPEKLICAVPVSPPDTLAKVEQLADEVVCLETPPYFQAVGQFYRHFPQIDDQEVIAILRTSALRVGDERNDFGY